MLIIDSLITVAPLIAYYSQYTLIAENKSVGSFSIDVCGILIVANIMRIFFWFSSGYAFNLFVQSFLVIGIQFMLLDICIKVGYGKGGRKENGFWRWRKINSFGNLQPNSVIFSLLFAGILGIFTLVCTKMEIKSFGPILGVFSLSLEATLGLPQLITNHRNKNVTGLSIFMIVTWFIGDFLKTMYFIIKLQPFQFIISGAFQLLIDTLILIQIMAYGDGETEKYQNVKAQYEIQYVPAK